jgi:hypothetical protein
MNAKNFFNLDMDLQDAQYRIKLLKVLECDKKKIIVWLKQLWLWNLKVKTEIGWHMRNWRVLMHKWIQFIAKCMQLNTTHEAIGCAGIQEPSNILRNPQVHYHIRKSSQLVPILS